MKRYPIFMLMYNRTPEQLELSKEAFSSAMAQDIGPLHLWIVNNGSTSETKEWLDSIQVESPHKLTVQHIAENMSPVKVGNRETATIFSLGYETILGLPNDVIVPPNMYRKLEEWPRGLVTASMTGDRNFPVSENVIAVSEATPMAVAMMRKWFYQAMVSKDGYLLDEQLFFYTSDCDLALRMAASGIRGIQLSIPYFHYGSASHRLSTPEVSQEIRSRADHDRALFQAKWGFKVDAPEYGEACGNINFRG
jgi:hypothetical protein